MWMSAPSTSTSAGFERPSIAARKKIPSAQCAEQATRLEKSFQVEACLSEEVEPGHTPWLPAPAVYSIAALNGPALARDRIIGDRRMVLAVGNAKRLAPPAEMKPFLHGIADRPMAHAFLEVDQLDLPIGRWFEFRNRAKRNDRRGRCLAFKRLRRHFNGRITEGAILHLG